MKPRHPILFRRLASRTAIDAVFDRLIPCGCSTNQEEEAMTFCDPCRFQEKCGLTGESDDDYCIAFVKNAINIMDKFDEWAKTHPLTE